MKNKYLKSVKVMVNKSRAKKKTLSDQNRLDSVITIDTLYKTIPATHIVTRRALLNSE